MDLLFLSALERLVSADLSQLQQGEAMSQPSDHLNGTNHHWDFVCFLNQQYSGTALTYQEALVICRKCGAWKMVPQQDYTPTGGVR